MNFKKTDGDMKKTKWLFGLVLSLIFFTNCKQSGEGSSTEPATAAEIPATLAGYWVNADWWKTLRDTRSPRAAAPKAEVAAAIIRQDSSRWVADLSYNWHEGQQLTIRSKDGGLQLYDPQNAAVTTMALAIQPGGAMIRLDSFNMVKLGDGFDGYKVISHTLVGGQYDLNGKTVVFNPNGTVVGLDGFKFYELNLDYVTDELDAETIILSTESQDGREVLAYRWNGNQLVLSEILDNEDPNGRPFIVGKARYTLAKQ